MHISGTFVQHDICHIIASTGLCAGSSWRSSDRMRTRKANTARCFVLFSPKATLGGSLPTPRRTTHCPRKTRASNDIWPVAVGSPLLIFSFAQPFPPLWQYVLSADYYTAARKPSFSSYCMQTAQAAPHVSALHVVQACFIFFCLPAAQAVLYSLYCTSVKPVVLPSVCRQYRRSVLTVLQIV